MTLLTPQIFSPTILHMSEINLNKTGLCQASGCDKRRASRGWCPKHYQRWRKYGDANYTNPYSSYQPADERFKLRIGYGAPDECWPWLGATDGAGLGALNANGNKNYSARRFAYELAHKVKLDSNQRITPMCGSRLCVNPQHLQASRVGSGTREGQLEDYYLGRLADVDNPKIST